MTYVWRLWTNFKIIGNAMAFAGLPNAKDRGDVIAYLKASKWAVFKPNGAIVVIGQSQMEILIWWLMSQPKLKSVRDPNTI